MKETKTIVSGKASPELLIRKLSILIEINQAVSRDLNLEESLHAALHILARSYHIKSGMVFLLEGENILRMISSYGIKSELAKSVYRTGEGLTGRIAETGKPIVVPQVSKESTYLNRLGTWDSMRDKEQTYVGVPIILDYRILGVLAIILPYHARRDYDNTRKFLTLVASALLQPILFRQQIDVERKKLVDENISLKQQLQQEHNLNNVVGNSQEMREIYNMVLQVSPSNTTVLIRGETGTGKELIAQAIHYNSPRKDKPLIRVNCAAVPENLIESEFFGYEKGAFTGAVARKRGRFELADGGTIFLDEIGNLSQMTQTKLLRVLQEQEFERVGGSETLKVDIRVITATNANLEKMIKEGAFREDLYYRLNVFSIFLPPLRERKTDLLLLSDHFLLKYGRQQGKVIKRISTPAIDMLMRYHWPGNVRELENCIERAVLLCQDHVIHSYHLPPTLQTAESSNTITRQSLQDAVISYEEELIQDALKTTKGSQAKASRLLDTTERILGYKIKQYGIDTGRFKA